MNSNNKGIALVELLIVVMVISTLATALWNFHIQGDNNLAAPIEYSPLDSIAHGILDEITLNLRQARPDSLQEGTPIIIKHNSDSDEIDIAANGKKLFYYVNDKKFLIREQDRERGLLLSEVSSLKVVRLGSQTLLITLSIGLDSDLGDSNNDRRNYSRVVTVNSIL